MLDPRFSRKVVSIVEIDYPALPSELKELLKDAMMEGGILPVYNGGLLEWTVGESHLSQSQILQKIDKALLALGLIDGEWLHIDWSW